jgi:hypothetical protein
MILQWKKTVLTLKNFLRLKVLLITAYDLAHADQNGMAKLEQLNKDATAKGYKVE